MGVNITTIIYLRVLIIQIGSTIILMVVEAQGLMTLHDGQIMSTHHKKLNRLAPILTKYI